jgi:release factor glutamine methyltransferase
LLVERALEEMDRRRPVPRAIDIGTGSGCIAVTLAASRPDGRFVATDVSRDALTVARANASSYDVAEKICFVQTSLLESFGCVWDLVCANLPYLPAERLTDLDVARHEPGLALDGGRRGVRWLVPLIQALRRSLAGDGLALLEIDEGQADEFVRLAQNFLPDATVDCAADLAGRLRMLVIRRTAGVA